jgi:nucleotide-binding universal stress UspA family protein
MEARHILLTTDLSEESRRTFPVARSLARPGARITLIYVVPDLAVTPHGAPFAPPVASSGLGEHMEAARKEVEKLRASLGGAGVETRVLSGNDVAREVCRFAAENGCDMIVTSTHGRTGFRRMMLGSVAEGILRHATVPVLCVPRQD